MNQRSKLEALTKYLEVEPSEVDTVSYDDNLFDVGREQYLVLTDEEADERTANDIKGNLWAFNTDFIASHVPALRGKAAKAFSKMQAELCEAANDLVEALIPDMDRFIRDAVSSDGRGHFISSYDGEEHEVQVGNENFYVYRYN